MWSKLLDNTSIRKTLGSNNFVTDFQCSMSDTTSSHQENLGSNRYFFDHDTSKYTLALSLTNKGILKARLLNSIFVGSWNVGGVAPPEDLDMEEWLDTQNPADIYVLGFQEIVPLNAGNVIVSENRKISARWNNIIRKTLKRKTTPHLQEPKEGEYQKVYPVKDQNSAECRKSMDDFQCIISKQMVGIFISIWVKIDLRQHIRHTQVSSVGCGIMGCLGNKGSVSVRFCFHETSFCFVCSHLASGGKEGDEGHRNADAAEIMSRTSFPRGPLQNLPQRISDHDRVVWLGDLNYRISLPEATTRSLVQKKEWNVLLKNDQLKAELMEGHVFQGWDEGAIEFAPTYKYYPNSGIYYICGPKRKGLKSRAPAWCDRIIWFGKGLKQNQYDRLESTLSDHRPIRALFTADIEVLREAKGQGKCLSRRFDCSTHNVSDYSNNK